MLFNSTHLLSTNNVPVFITKIMDSGWTMRQKELLWVKKCQYIARNGSKGFMTNSQSDSQFPNTAWGRNRGIGQPPKCGVCVGLTLCYGSILPWIVAVIASGVTWFDRPDCMVGRSLKKGKSRVDQSWALKQFWIACDCDSVRTPIKDEERNHHLAVDPLRLGLMSFSLLLLFLGVIFL